MLTNGLFTRQTCIAGVEIREVPEDHAAYGHAATVNYGLYATRDWKVGEMVGEYTGQVRFSKDCSQSSSRYILHFGKMGAAAGSSGLQQAADQLVIDAEKYGNETRFINHFSGIHSSPNVRFKLKEKDGHNAMVVEVVRQVKGGQELLIDYGPRFKSD